MKKQDNIVDIKIFRKKKQSDEASTYYSNLYNEKLLTSEEAEYLLNQIQQDDKPTNVIDFKYIAAVTLLIFIASSLTVFLLASVL